MSGIIILAGGGDEQKSRQIDERFKYYVSKLGVSNTLYVPLASHSNNDYAKAINWFESTYVFLPNITTVASTEDIADVITANFDVIYIGGGNTGSLSLILKKHELGEYIVSRLRQGAIIYGGSAGAIVLGKTIATAPDKELTAPENMDGLGVLGDYSVLPHFKKSFQQRDIKNAHQHKTKLLGIAEDAGVVIKDGDIVETVNSDGVSEYDPLTK